MKKTVCGMCIYFRMGKCELTGENKDCLEERCDDFKGYFDKGD